MNCFGKENGKNIWVKRLIFMPIVIAIGVFVFGNVVMFLWNGILPVVIGVGTITFWQAIGILILSKILFSNFRPSHSRYNSNSEGRNWSHSWMNMSPEEKEKMKAEWKSRCKPSKE